MDEKASWPNYWVSKDPRVPSITLAHVIDDVFELVSGGARDTRPQGRP